MQEEPVYFNKKTGKRSPYFLSKRQARGARILYQKDRQEEPEYLNKKIDVQARRFGIS